MISTVLIGLGTNLGDRRVYLESALEELGLYGRVMDVSPIYETDPIGAAEHIFLNGALLYQTSLRPLELIEKIAEIEVKLDRKRVVKWGDRTIDLDILLWKTESDELILVDRPNLKIPHPEMLNRDFVLVPACDLVSDWKFPASKYTLREICSQKAFSLSGCKYFQFPMK